MKARRMLDAATRGGGHCPQGQGRLPLRDTQSPRDAVTRPAPIHSHTSGRARARSRSAPTTPVRGGRWQGPLGRRERRLKASDKEQSPADLERPGRGVQRKRARAFCAKPGRRLSPPLNQVQQRFLPQGHTQAHSSLVKGPESCATVPVPNLAVAPAGRSAPLSPPSPLRSSPKERPPWPAQVTHEEPQTSCELLSDYLAAAAAPNGVRASSEFRGATSATPATPVPHCPPRHVQLPVLGANFSTVSRETRAAGVPRGAGGETATSRVYACSQRVWGLDPDTVRRPLDRITGGLRDPGSAQKGRSAAAAGAPPTRGPAGRSALRRPRHGRFQPRWGAVSLGPDPGPLQETRRRLPAALPSALPGKGWCEPGAPPRPPSSPKHPGDARAKEGVALRVSSSQRLGSSVPPPLSHPRAPPQHFCSQVRAVTPPLQEHTRNCPSPNSADAAPAHPGSGRLGALTHRGGGHAGVSGALGMRGFGDCPEHSPPSQLTSPGLFISSSSSSSPSSSSSLWSLSLQSVETVWHSGAPPAEAGAGEAGGGGERSREHLPPGVTGGAGGAARARSPRQSGAGAPAARPSPSSAQRPPLRPAPPFPLRPPLSPRRGSAFP